MTSMSVAMQRRNFGQLQFGITEEESWDFRWLVLGFVGKCWLSALWCYQHSDKGDKMYALFLRLRPEHSVTLLRTHAQIVGTRLELME